MKTRVHTMHRNQHPHTTRALAAFVLATIASCAAPPLTSQHRSGLCTADDPDCGAAGSNPSVIVRDETTAYKAAYYPTAQQISLSCGSSEPGVASCSLHLVGGWIDCWVSYDPDTGDIEDAGCEYLPG